MVSRPSSDFPIEKIFTRLLDFSSSACTVNVFRVGQFVGRPGNGSPDFFRRRDRIGGGQVIDQFRQEKLFGGVLQDLGGVASSLFCTAATAAGGGAFFVF